MLLQLLPAGFYSLRFQDSAQVLLFQVGTDHLFLAVPQRLLELLHAAVIYISLARRLRWALSQVGAGVILVITAGNEAPSAEAT
jgi:hypothetical protein